MGIRSSYKYVWVYTLFFTFVILAVDAGAQRLGKPIEIKTTGNYTHSATSTILPANIDGYTRTEVSTFNRQQTEIVAKYEQKNREGKTTVSVFIYPAGEVSNYRFRAQYQASAQSIAIAADRRLEGIQTYRSVAKDGYKIHGFNAFIKNRRQNTSLELYECGDWFLKIRVTSDHLDSTGIYKLNERMVEVVNPINLVKHSTFTPQSTITFNELMFTDSLLMGMTISRAFEELQWAQDNIDSMERLAGFPSLYLEMHVSSLKKAVEFADNEHYQSVTAKTTDFLRQLRAIIANNYLEQFVSEQYDMLLTSKNPDVTYNFTTYYEWKKKNRITINLNDQMYVIRFVAKDKK